MTANGNEAVTLKQLKSTFSAERGDINLDFTATGDEVVTLKQLKMLRDNLTDDILGQFSDELDTIIGADTTPIPDAIAWADKINGEDVSGGSGSDWIDYGEFDKTKTASEIETLVDFRPTVIEYSYITINIKEGYSYILVLGESNSNSVFAFVEINTPSILMYSEYQGVEFNTQFSSVTKNENSVTLTFIGPTVGSGKYMYVK